VSQPVHGSPDLPGLHVDGYNAELREGSGGFVGDRASSQAFRFLLDDLRERFPDGEDPLGEGEGVPSKKRLDQVLRDGDPEAGGVIVGAIEAWAQEFAGVIHRFLRLPAWRETERIVVGGGLRGSRCGELAIGRTVVLLRGEGLSLQLHPVRHDPDEAGLVGAAHLFPPERLAEGDAVLAADIGGTNMRAGLVTLGGAPDLSEAAVSASEQWKHGDEEPTREQAVERLAGMLRSLADQAESKGLRLARLVGIGCPGLITADGEIERGGQNLPGNWEEPGFNLPRLLADAMPGGWHVLMHNDAVVQGLSQVPWMRDVARWGVMTAGTGLGNARFTNAG
jgi:predicted NBD/HSP70 family sugar kinase